MADVERKSIIVDIGVLADEATQDTGQLRVEMEALKDVMRSMGAETEESLAVVESSLKRTFDANQLDPLRAKIAAMKAELRGWEQIPIAQQELARDQGFITGTEEDLAVEQEKLRLLTDAARLSVAELRKEFIKNAEAAQKKFR